MTADQFNAGSFVREVIQELSMEFAVEAPRLIGISLEGAGDAPDVRHSGAAKRNPESRARKST